MDAQNYNEYYLESAVYKTSATKFNSQINILIEIEKNESTDSNIVNFLDLERVIYLTIREWTTTSDKLFVDVRNMGIDDVGQLQDSLIEICGLNQVLIKQEWQFIDA